MANTWFARRGSKVVGPLPATKLIELAKTGKLLRTDEISRDGGNTWTSAASVFAVKTPEAHVKPADGGKTASAQSMSAEQAALSQIASDHSQTQQLKREQSDTHDGFALERKGTESGVLGGVLMIAIAVTWFGLGLWAGRIFFYPPILFIVGFVAVIKGVWTGKASGPRKS